jgi:quercetin dioxygenase-like cupin family protein
MATALVALVVLTPAAATPPVNETFTPLAPASSLYGRVKAKAATGDWKMRIATSAATDVLTAEVIHPPGSSSGWHKHPGPAIITVAAGTLTFYFGDDPTCSPTRVHAGQTVIEEGGARSPAHYAVNEGTQDVRVLVTLFAPKGVFPRIDVPEAPGNCPF